MMASSHTAPWWADNHRQQKLPRQVSYSGLGFLQGLTHVTQYKVVQNGDASEKTILLQMGA
jgi:hypothetical protein